MAGCVVNNAYVITLKLLFLRHGTKTTSSEVPHDFNTLSSIPSTLPVSLVLQL